MEGVDMRSLFFVLLEVSQGKELLQLSLKNHFQEDYFGGTASLQAKPNQAKPSQAKPSQAKPSLLFLIRSAFSIR